MPVKRCLIVGSLAATFLLPVSAMAELNVTIFGLVDTGLSYVQVSRDAVGSVAGLNNSQLGMDSGVQSGSRWGFRGSEDLGNGWVASFVLEGGLDSTTGQAAQGGRMFGRRSTIGITNARYFDLQLGRQTNISTNYFGFVDPMNLNFGQANMGASFGSVNTVRYDNLVQIQTPSLGGLQFGVGYSFNTGQSGLYETSGGPTVYPRSSYFGTNANMRALTAAVQFNKGPWDVAISYDRVFSAGIIPNLSGSGTQASPDQATPTAWIVGVSYDFDVIRVAGAYGKTYDGAFSGSGPGNSLSGTGLATVTGGAGINFTPGFDSQSAVFGMAMPIGGDGNLLMMSWQMQQPQGQLAQSEYFATQNIVGLAYTHYLSKQTNLYFWASYGDNFQMRKSAKSSVVGAGVRHLF